MQTKSTPEFWSVIRAKIPAQHEREFLGELSIINLSRIRFFAPLVAALVCLLVLRELGIIGTPLWGQNKLVLYLHIALDAGLLLLFFAASRKTDVGESQWNNCLVVIAAEFTLIICALISLIFPLNTITTYVLGCFGVANILYLRPRTSFSLYALAHIVYCLGLTHSSVDQFSLQILYIDGTLAAVIGWFISLALFNTRINDFLNRKKIESYSSLDGLTGIANRRQFDKILEAEWNRALRNDTPVSLVLIDIDFFKAFNDACGHLAGDDCLQQIASVISGVVRRSGDLAARYGGEEFAVILPGTDAQGAAVVAERLRFKTEALEIHHPRSRINRNVTISLGVSTMVPETASSPEILLGQADKALYDAKRAGRNIFKVCNTTGKRDIQAN